MLMTDRHEFLIGSPAGPFRVRTHAARCGRCVGEMAQRMGPEPVYLQVVLKIVASTKCQIGRTTIRNTALSQRELIGVAVGGLEMVAQGGQSRYRDVYQSLKEAILRGTYPYGARVPSIRTIASQ